ncbi:MAG: hypothetical protein AAAC47_13875 [Pararhizobium sp.]
MLKPRSICRRTAHSNVGRLPDDRLVIATALLALANLLLLLGASVV